MELDAAGSTTELHERTRDGKSSRGRAHALVAAAEHRRDGLPIRRSSRARNRSADRFRRHQGRDDPSDQDRQASSDSSRTTSCDPHGNCLTLGRNDRVDHSLDYNSLTYRDPTGNQAVRNLMSGDVSVTWPDGFTIWLSEADARPLVHLIRTYFAFRKSRKGLLWGTAKNKNPGSCSSSTGAKTGSPEGETVHVHSQQYHQPRYES